MSDLFVSMAGNLPLPENGETTAALRDCDQHAVLMFVATLTHIRHPLHPTPYFIPPIISVMATAGRGRVIALGIEGSANKVGVGVLLYTATASGPAEGGSGSGG